MSRIHNWQRFLLLASLYAALVACQGEPNDTTVGDQGNTPRPISRAIGIRSFDA